MSNKLEETEQKRMPLVTSSLGDDSKGQITNRPCSIGIPEIDQQEITFYLGQNSNNSFAISNTELDRLLKDLEIPKDQFVEPLEIPKAEEGLSQALTNNPLYQKTIHDINQLLLDKIKSGAAPGLPIRYECDPKNFSAYRGIEPCVRHYYKKRKYHFAVRQQQSSKGGPYNQFIFFVGFVKISESSQVTLGLDGFSW